MTRPLKTFRQHTKRLCGWRSRDIGYGWPYGIQPTVRKFLDRQVHFPLLRLRGFVHYFAQDRVRWPQEAWGLRQHSQETIERIERPQGWNLRNWGGIGR